MVSGPSVYDESIKKYRSQKPGETAYVKDGILTVGGSPLKNSQPARRSDVSTSAPAPSANSGRIDSPPDGTTTLNSTPNYGTGSPASAWKPPPAPKYSLDQVMNAIYGQESNYGKNAATSSAGAHGPMQIIKPTWDQYALPNEDIDNPQHNMAVGRRIISDYYSRYNGDPAKIFTAYYSGPGNVNTDTDAKTPYVKDMAYGKVHVSDYINQATPRLDGAVAPEVATNANPSAAAPADQPTAAGLLGQGNVSGAIGALAANPMATSGMDALSKGLGGGAAAQKSMPQPMAPPHLQTNQAQIASMAPQLMAQLMAGQQAQQRPIMPLDPRQRPQIPGLSLGGFGYGV